MTITSELQSEYVQGTWKIDPAHSEVSFSVRHLMIAKVRGVFEKVDVTIVTPEDPKDTTIEAVIDVASVNTNQSGRWNDSWRQRKNRHRHSSRSGKVVHLWVAASMRTVAQKNFRSPPTC